MCSCSWWLTSLQACFWFVVKEILNEFVIWPRAPINPLSPLQTSMCAWSPMLTMWPPRASTSPLSAPQWKPVNLRLRSNQLWSCWSPSTKSQSHVLCRFYQLIFNLLKIIKFLNYAQWVNVLFFYPVQVCGYQWSLWAHRRWNWKSGENLIIVMEKLPFTPRPSLHVCHNECLCGAQEQN